MQLQTKRQHQVVLNDGLLTNLREFEEQNQSCNCPWTVAGFAGPILQLQIYSCVLNSAIVNLHVQNLNFNSAIVNLQSQFWTVSVQVSCNSSIGSVFTVVICKIFYLFRRSQKTRIEKLV